MIETVPRVSLAVSHGNRPLEPNVDGYLGDLASGKLEIRATVAPGALVYGIRRWGDDAYDLQKDCAAAFGLNGGEKVYTAVTGLEANWETSEPFVPYPNNLLLLAEFVTDKKVLTNRVHIWRVAVVSQKGSFFLTVQKGYDTTAHRDTAGRCVFPRLKAHVQLETILTRLRPNAEGAITFPRRPLPDERCPRNELVRADNVATVADLPPLSAFVPDPEPTLLKLRTGEAHVLRFYDARGIGTVLTSLGVARVNWRDCPPRERRRYLVSGEQVRFERLGKPKPHRPHLRFEDDKLRPGRETRFTRQAYGITLSSPT